MPTSQSEAMTNRIKSSNSAQNMKKCIWVIQPAYVIRFLYVCIFTSIFRTVAEVKKMSTMDSLGRKKYMGVWMWESELMVRMISRSTNIEIMCMDRKSPNMRSCSYGAFDNLRRKKLWNLCIIAWFHVVVVMTTNNIYLCIYLYISWLIFTQRVIPT